ncbi:MAG: BrnT family toxin [Hyphomicrobiaceae bacterium]
MEFEWDDIKNETNFAKHGFDFEHAIQIFEGPLREYVDPRAWEEQRIVATGRVGGAFITVVYTRRNGRYRIISARPARRSERF